MGGQINVRNYRSKNNILQAANEVIANNNNRKDKALRTTQEDGNKIKIYRAFDDRAECDFVSKTISDLQEITSLLQSAGLQEVGVSSEQIGKAAMDFYTISQYLAALGMAGGSATEVMNKLQKGKLKL